MHGLPFKYLEIIYSDLRNYVKTHLNNNREIFYKKVLKTAIYILKIIIKTE